MGFSGISLWQLLIILAIVALLFGTKRLRNMGGDLGDAIKGFKKALHSDDENREQAVSDKTENKKSDTSTSIPSNNNK